jgi:hypothetical protein
MVNLKIVTNPISTKGIISSVLEIFYVKIM